jgi:dTMP kinase
VGVTSPPTRVPQRTGPTESGVFCTFEGGDGVGKSTQIRLLVDWLTERGVEVVSTHEPGDSELGRQLRAAVMHGDHVSARTEALLYATDRAHHVDTVVRPALERGAVVVCDRYIDSSVAYQGVGRGRGADDIERLSLWATEGLMPDLTVLLDLDPEVGLSRLSDRAEQPERLESAGVGFHSRARGAFLERAVADPDRWLMVDAGGSVDQVSATIRARVAEMLGLDP